MSASGEAQFSRVCDRAGAREARAIIRDQLLQVAHHHGVSISEHCPLHPNHDRLRLHESHKQMTTQNQWKCALCGKMFRSEHYIDLHLERKHHHTLPQNATMCLGDFCDILRCPSWADSMLHSLRSGHAGCRGRELETRRHFCQHMVHDCVEHHRSGAAGSGAVGSGAAHALFEELDAHFCAPLNCEWREGLRLGHHRLDLPGSNASNGYYVLAALLLMAVSGVYFGLFCWYSATKAVSGDLRARRQRRTRCCGFLHKQKSY